MKTGEVGSLHVGVPSRAPGESPAVVTPAADDATVSEKIRSLWGRSIREHDRPDVTIKEAAQAARHTASISSRLNVRPQAVAEPGVSMEPPPHYQILRLLGKGGMGVVYEARQTSVDRTIALKMIKQEAAQDKQERNAFLAEAVATADLDHPNIVPVYDLGANDQGILFYAMKEVQGTPWSKAIKDKSPNENLDVLMRVADAVAFAHSKGIIHRDLKPENVMLGEYGEVLLMDWGMAAAVQPGAKAEQLSEDYAVGGTPAYMAPEMAYGEIEKIGPASDVYLLGAILFEIIAGKRPHAGGTVMACLQNAADNKIQETEVKGELLDIALKAMATEPKDRFAGVKEFQAQVRLYQRHAESIVLATQAGEELGRAKQAKQYMLYAEAVSGYRQALKLWAKNKAAQKGLIEARLAYAGCAMEKDDLDLAASLLDSSEGSHREMARKVETARKERTARKMRLRVFKTMAVGSAGIAFVTMSVAFVWVQLARRGEVVQRKKAEQALANFEAEQVRRQADRKSSAPALVDAARALTEKKQFKSALASIGSAIEYDPELGEARLIQALLLIQAKNYAQAAEAAAAYQRLCPDDGTGKAVAEVARQGASHGATSTADEKLAAAASRQGMPMLGAEFVQRLAAQLLLYRSKLDKAWPGSGARLLSATDRTLQLNLGGYKGVADLTPIGGIPLTTLSLRQIPVADLSPLKGMPLTTLDLCLTSVSDLSPLAGMPLTSLNLYCTQVSDLSPLKGMPLDTLGIYYCSKVSDLSPLKGMPLAVLNIVGTAIRDLTPLKGMPLKRLEMTGVPVRDLAPLSGMPLEYLDCSNCREIRSLTPLAGAPLKSLNCSMTAVLDLSSLKGMPLTTLAFGGSAVRDVSLLKGMPIESLDLSGTVVSDLTPLKGMPLLKLNLRQSAVRDLTPLEGMKLGELIFSPCYITNGIDIVRAMNSITAIAGSGQTLKQWSPSEFWKKYDEGEFNKREWK